MDFSFETKGLAQYEQMLLAMGTKHARAAGRAALRQGTNIILRASRTLAKVGHPAYPNKLTGRMAKSIVTTDRGIVGDTITFSVDVKRIAFYARFVEFGTSHAMPYPFMRPAAENNAAEAVSMMAEVLGKQIAMRWGKR